jgi:integrase
MMLHDFGPWLQALLLGKFRDMNHPAAYGLRQIRFHDLRDTCATLLGKYANPKVVSEMLGHSSVSITLDIYSHLLPDMQE